MTLHTRILELLRAPDSPHLNTLSELIVDTLLDATVSELVELEDIAEPIIAGASRTGWLRTAARHAAPAWKLERHRAEKSGDTLGDFIPPTIRKGIEERAGRPLGMPLDWADGIVDPVFVRDLTAGVLQDALQDFVANIPIGGKLFGGIAKGIGSLGKRSSNALTPFVKDFARSYSGKIRERVKARLETPEGEKALREMRRRAIAQAMTLPLTHLYDVAEDPGIDTYLEWGEALREHNMARPEVGGAIVGQIWLALKLVADTPARELLDELEVTTVARQRLLRTLRSAATRVLATQAFSHWLKQLLQDAS